MATSANLGANTLLHPNQTLRPQRVLPEQAALATSENRAWTLEHLMFAGLTAGIVFINAADFRGDTGADEFQVHWQIYVRLLCTFACGGLGFLYSVPHVFRTYAAWPGLLLTAYAGVYAGFLPASVSRNYSAAALLSLLCILIFVPAAMRVLGGTRFLLALAVGLTTHLIGSWIAYLFFPEVGVFMEQVTQTDIYERMGGLAHPNELGFYAAYTTLVFAGLGRAEVIARTVAAAGMLLGITTIVGCFSRTAAIVTTLGLIVVFWQPLRRPGNLVGGMLATATVILVAFLAVGSGQFDWFIESVLTKLTKSGSTSELTTATGRTEIWQYAISCIQQSPVVGYGYATARFVMSEHSYHGHNIVLNALLFGGVLSGLIVISMIVYLGTMILFRSRPIVDGLAAAMLAGGMVDGLLGAASPAASTVIWIMLLLWRYHEHVAAAEPVELLLADDSQTLH